MFLLLEFILYGFLIVFDWSWIKYLSIFICFCYLMNKGKGYKVFVVILVADVLLLWSEAYEIGIYCFMIVQCFYHSLLKGKKSFNWLLITIFYPHIVVLSIVYALMSIWNLILAIYRRHWLAVTIGLLALCDMCVVIQFLTHINIRAIWWFYLPSQVWYTKKILSNEERTIVKVN